MNSSAMRFLLYVLFLLVTGCSGSSNAPESTSFNQVLFDPSSGTVPLPNILATAGAKDPLTQYVDATGSVIARPANTPMTPPEALAYINKYEMGSTNAVAGLNAPIYIRFSSPVDSATLTAANVKVFQLTPDNSGGSSTENNPLGFTDVSSLFDFKYTAGGTDLFLFPDFPLLPSTRYLYVVSSRVKDAATGGSVRGSVNFEALKSQLPLTGSFAALEAVRADVKASNGTDIKLSGYAKVMNDLIAAAAATTISSRNDIAVLGRFITSGAGFLSRDDIGGIMPVESALREFAAGAAPGGLSGINWSNAVTGVAILPAASYWTAVTGSAATLPGTVVSVATGNIISAELSIDPVIATTNSTTMDLSAVAGAFNPAAGVVKPFRSGGILTGFYHTLRTVPFVYFVPASPSGKVIIFQHGITGHKEQAMAVAGSLTAAGFAVAAIDLPLHGELSPTHAVVSGDSAIEIFQKRTLWGQDFIAAGAPLATRSNIQQAAFNLNRLELTLKSGGLIAAGISTAQPAEIKFVGQSLGSIVGAYYLAGNTSLVTTVPPYSQTTLNSDMKGLLSVPGGRVAYLLMDSPTFRFSINAGLAAKGIFAGTPAYNQFFQVTQSIVDTVDPATMTTPLEAALPSRLSGRIAIQEATGGDLVIPNANTRYFGNALGGREVMGLAGAAVAPGFKQLGYQGGRIPATFMFTLNSAAVPTPKVAVAATSVAATTPNEGYFQFDQPGVSHGFLLDPTGSAALTGLAQKQMMYFLTLGVVVDPSAAGLPKTSAGMVPGLAGEILLPPVLKIFGY